jgi:type II secretory pathway component PulL
MNKLLSFQKDKDKLKLLFFHIGKDRVFIKDYKEYEIEAGNKDKAVEFIKKFVSDNKAVSVQTICSLPMSSVYIRKITFPYRRISKIKKSIRFAVEPHIPIPVENTKVFFYPIHAKNNNLEVMAFVIPEDILNEQIELINSAELACNEIYFAPLTLVNLFASNIQIKENILWLYVGENSTYIFSILKNRQLTDLREIPVGRKNLTHEKSELKREISTILLSQGSEFFENGIGEIYISGLQELEEQTKICDWLTKNFNITVKPVELNTALPVEQGDLNFIPEILYTNYGRLRPHSINFYTSVLKEKERKGIRFSFFLVALALIIFSFRLQFERSIYEKKFNMMNSRIEKIFRETFPEATDTRTPLLQMKSRINSLRNSAIQSKSESLSPLEALREISQNIDKNLQIKLDSFKLKEDNITISGSASSPADIDKIKETFEKLPFFSGIDIEIQRTDKGVTFRLKAIVVRSDVPSGTKISEK